MMEYARQDRAEMTTGRVFDTNKLILAVLIGGFLMTAIEVRYLHRDANRQTLAAWIPTLASLAGAIACTTALFTRRIPRLIPVGILSLVAISGPIGLYFHTGFQPSAFSVLFTSQTALAESGEAEEEDGRVKIEQAHGGPPALAPLGVSGLALVGCLAIYSVSSIKRNQE